MNSIYDLLEHLATGSKHVISSKSLNSVRDYFFGYTAGLAAANRDLEEGEPPFSQFSSWLARRFGKSKRSLYGRWTADTRGWWRIVEEQAGNGESGFNAFFELVAEFRQRRRVFIGRTSELSDADVSFPESDSDNPTRLEAVEFVPNDGYYMSFIYRDGRTKVEGFYSTIDELISSAKNHYKVPSDRWCFAETGESKHL